MLLPSHSLSPLTRVSMACAHPLHWRGPHAVVQRQRLLHMASLLCCCCVLCCAATLQAPWLRGARCMAASWADRRGLAWPRSPFLSVCGSCTSSRRGARPMGGGTEGLVLDLRCHNTAIYHGIRAGCPRVPVGESSATPHRHGVAWYTTPAAAWDFSRNSLGVSYQKTALGTGS